MRRKRYRCTFCGHVRVSDFSKPAYGIIACSKCEREMAENFEKHWQETHPPVPVYRNGTDEIVYWIKH